jgi:hypothetical protein
LKFKNLVRLLPSCCYECACIQSPELTCLFDFDSLLGIGVLLEVNTGSCGTCQVAASQYFIRRPEKGILQQMSSGPGLAAGSPGAEAIQCGYHHTPARDT